MGPVPTEPARAALRRPWLELASSRWPTPDEGTDALVWATYARLLERLLTESQHDVEVLRAAARPGAARRLADELVAALDLRAEAQERSPGLEPKASAIEEPSEALLASLGPRPDATFWSEGSGVDTRDQRARGRRRWPWGRSRDTAPDPGS